MLLSRFVGKDTCTLSAEIFFQRESWVFLFALRVLLPVLYGISGSVSAFLA